MATPAGEMLIRFVVRAEGQEQADAVLKQLEGIGIKAKASGAQAAAAHKQHAEAVGKTGNAYGGLLVRLSATLYAVKGLYSAWQEEVKSQRALGNSIQNNTTLYDREGKSVSALKKELMEFAEAREQATGIDTIETQQAMSTLLAMGTRVQDLKRVTLAFQDMQAKTGVSMMMMARSWSRLSEMPEEALTALSRVGLRLTKEMLEGKSAEEQRILVLGMLERRFKGQAQTMYEAAGATARLETNLGNLAKLGGSVAVNVFSPIINGLSRLLKLFMDAPPVIQILIAAVAGIEFAMSKAGKAFLEFSKKWLMTPFGKVTAILVGVGLAAEALFSSFEGAKVDIEGVKAAIDGLDSALDKAGDSMSDADKNTVKLLESLRNTKTGTAEYYAAADAVIKSNPKLANSNLTIASSYDAIAAAVMGVLDAQNRAELLKNYDASFKQMADLIPSIKNLDAQFNSAMSKGDADLANRVKIQLEAQREMLATLAGQTMKANSMLGFSANTWWSRWVKEVGSEKMQLFETATWMRGDLGASGDGMKLRNTQALASGAEYLKQSIAIMKAREDAKKLSMHGGAAPASSKKEEKEKKLYDPEQIKKDIEFLKQGLAARNATVLEYDKKLLDINYQYADEMKKIAATDDTPALKKKYGELADERKRLAREQVLVEKQRAVDEAKIQLGLAASLTDIDRNRLESERTMNEELRKNKAAADFLLSTETDPAKQAEIRKSALDADANARKAHEKRVADYAAGLWQKFYDENSKKLAETTKGAIDYIKKTGQALADAANEFLNSYEFDTGGVASGDLDAENKAASDPENEKRKKALVDIQQMKIDMMLDEFDKRQALLDKQYEDEQKKIDDMLANEEISIEDAEALRHGLKMKHVKDEGDLEREQQEQILSKIADGFNLATSIIRKDWKGAIGQVISGISPALGGVFSTAVGFFGSIFGSTTETALDKMEKRLNKISEDMAAAGDEEGLSLTEKIFGSDSEKYADTAVKDAQKEVDVFMKSNPLLAGMSDEQMLAFRDQLAGSGDFFKSLGGSGHSFYTGQSYDLSVDPEQATAAYDKMVAAIRAKYGDNADAVLASLGIRTDVGTSGFNRWLTTRFGSNNFLNVYASMGKSGDAFAAGLAASAGEAAEALKLLDDAKIRASLAGYEEELEKIDHKLKTGAFTDDEAVAAQIKIYDQMLAQLATLDASAEKEAAMAQVEEDRWALIEKQNDALADQKELIDGIADAEAARAIKEKMANLESYQLQIAKGQIADDKGAALQQQAMYREIISMLKAAGASTDVINEWEKKLIEFVTGKIGANTYGALSGTGSQVFITPDATASRAQSSAVTSRAKTSVATTTAGVRHAASSMPAPQVNVSQSAPVQQYNLNATMPPDVIGWMQRVVRTQTKTANWPGSARA